MQLAVSLSLRGCRRGCEDAGTTSVLYMHPSHESEKDWRLAIASSSGEPMRLCQTVSLANSLEVGCFQSIQARLHLVVRLIQCRPVILVLDARNDGAFNDPQIRFLPSNGNEQCSGETDVVDLGPKDPSTKSSQHWSPRYEDCAARCPLGSDLLPDGGHDFIAESVLPLTTMFVGFDRSHAHTHPRILLLPSVVFEVRARKNRGLHTRVVRSKKKCINL